MNTHRTLKAIGVAVSLLIACAVGFSATSPERPNFVIIFTDDQGYEDVGCFGSPNIKTPNLDRMAREGMRFTDFYVGQPVSSAARDAEQTGWPT